MVTTRIKLLDKPNSENSFLIIEQDNNKFTIDDLFNTKIKDQILNNWFVGSGQSTTLTLRTPIKLSAFGLHTNSPDESFNFVNQV